MYHIFHLMSAQIKSLFVCYIFDYIRLGLRSFVSNIRTNFLLNKHYALELCYEVISCWNTFSNAQFGLNYLHPSCNEKRHINILFITNG